jgi:hypothetical protein
MNNPIWRNQVDRLTRLLDTVDGRIDGHDTGISDLVSSVAGLATGASTRLYTETVTAASHTAAAKPVILCDCASNAITVNLPAAAQGRFYFIKKIDATANAVTIDGNSSETIDGATTLTIGAQYDAVTIVANTSAWYIV